MERREKDKEIEKLSKILSIVQNIYHKKKEQLENLQLEITELKEVLNHLNSIVSGKSFYSAEEFYLKTSNKLDEVPIDDYFREKIPEKQLEGTVIKRKIFSKDKQDLLCVLNFFDLNRVEIKFLEPSVRAIKESLEDFINIFLKEALIKIKESNPELDVKYKYFKSSDIIESIEISNVKSVSDYDLITSKIKELLTSDTK